MDGRTMFVVVVLTMNLVVFVTAVCDVNDFLWTADLTCRDIEEPPCFLLDQTWVDIDVVTGAVSCVDIRECDEGEVEINAPTLFSDRFCEADTASISEGSSNVVSSDEKSTEWTDHNSQTNDFYVKFSIAQAIVTPNEDVEICAKLCDEWGTPRSIPEDEYLMVYGNIFNEEEQHEVPLFFNGTSDGCEFINLNRGVYNLQLDPTIEDIERSYNLNIDDSIITIYSEYDSNVAYVDLLVESPDGVSTRDYLFGLRENLMGIIGDNGATVTPITVRNSKCNKFSSCIESLKSFSFNPKDFEESSFSEYYSPASDDTWHSDEGTAGWNSGEDTGSGGGTHESNSGEDTGSGGGTHESNSGEDTGSGGGTHESNSGEDTGSGGGTHESNSGEDTGSGGGTHESNSGEDTGSGGGTHEWNSGEDTGSGGGTHEWNSGDGTLHSEWNADGTPNSYYDEKSYNQERHVKDAYLLRFGIIMSTPTQKTREDIASAVYFAAKMSKLELAKFHVIAVVVHADPCTTTPIAEVCEQDQGIWCVPLRRDFECSWDIQPEGPEGSHDSSWRECNGNQIGDSCSFYCHNYHYGDGAQVFCTQQGWETLVPDINCTRISCPMPQLPVNQVINPDRICDDLSCAVRCNNGIERAALLNCVEGDTWDNINDVMCNVPEVCDAFPDIGDWEATQNCEGNSCVYTCPNGFVMRDYCEPDMSWRNPQDLVDCNAPLPCEYDTSFFYPSEWNEGIEDECKKLLSPLPHDHFCSFRCKEGYRSVYDGGDGHSEMICNNGEWTNPEVHECEPITCDKKPEVDFAVIDCTGDRIGDECTYTCPPGFLSWGKHKSTIKCQSWGEWDWPDLFCFDTNSRVECHNKWLPGDVSLDYGVFTLKYPGKTLGFMHNNSFVSLSDLDDKLDDDNQFSPKKPNIPWVADDVVMGYSEATLKLLCSIRIRCTGIYGDEENEIVYDSCPKSLGGVPDSLIPLPPSLDSNLLTANFFNSYKIDFPDSYKTADRLEALLIFRAQNNMMMNGHDNDHEDDISCWSLNNAQCFFEFNNGTWDTTRESVVLKMKDDITGEIEDIGEQLAPFRQRYESTTSCSAAGVESGFELLKTALKKLESASSAEDIQGMQEVIFTIGDNDFWRACETRMNQFTTEGIRSFVLPNSRECLEEYESAKWLADPCCNWNLRWTQCCAPRAVNHTFYGRVGVDMDKLSKECPTAGNEARAAANKLVNFMAFDNACQTDTDIHTLWEQVEEQRSTCHNAVFNPESGSCGEDCYTECINNECVIPWDDPFEALAKCYVSNLDSKTRKFMETQWDVIGATTEEFMEAFRNNTSKVTCVGPNSHQFQHRGDHVKIDPDCDDSENIELFGHHCPRHFVENPPTKEECLAEKTCNWRDCHGLRFCYVEGATSFMECTQHIPDRFYFEWDTQVCVVETRQSEISCKAANNENYEWINDCPEPCGCVIPDAVEENCQPWDRWYNEFPWNPETNSEEDPVCIISHIRGQFVDKELCLSECPHCIFVRSECRDTETPQQECHRGEWDYEYGRCRLWAFQSRSDCEFSGNEWPECGADNMQDFWNTHRRCNKFCVDTTQGEFECGMDQQHVDYNVFWNQESKLCEVQNADSEIACEEKGFTWRDQCGKVCETQGVSESFCAECFGDFCYEKSDMPRCLLPMFHNEAECEASGGEWTSSFTRWHKECILRTAKTEEECLPKSICPKHEDIFEGSFEFTQNNEKHCDQICYDPNADKTACLSKNQWRHWHFSFDDDMDFGFDGTNINENGGPIDPNDHGFPNSNDHSDGFPNSNGHGDGFPDSSGNIDGFPNSNDHSDGFPDSSGNIDGFPNSNDHHSDGFPHSNGHGDGFPDSSGNIDGFPNSNDHSDGFPDSNGHIDGFPASNEYSEEFFDNGDGFSDQFNFRKKRSNAGGRCEVSIYVPEDEQCFCAVPNIHSHSECRGAFIPGSWISVTDESRKRRDFNDNAQESGDNFSGTHDGHTEGSGDNFSGTHDGHTEGSGDNFSGTHDGHTEGSGDNFSGTHYGHTEGSGDNFSGTHDGHTEGSGEEFISTYDKGYTENTHDGSHYSSTHDMYDEEYSGTHYSYYDGYKEDECFANWVDYPDSDDLHFGGVCMTGLEWVDHGTGRGSNRCGYWSFDEESHHDIFIDADWTKFNVRIFDGFCDIVLQAWVSTADLEMLEISLPGTLSINVDSNGNLIEFPDSSTWSESWFDCYVTSVDEDFCKHTWMQEIGDLAFCRTGDTSTRAQCDDKGLEWTCLGDADYDDEAEGYKAACIAQGLSWYTESCWTEEINGQEIEHCWGYCVDESISMEQCRPNEETTWTAWEPHLANGEGLCRIGYEQPESCTENGFVFLSHRTWIAGRYETQEKCTGSCNLGHFIGDHAAGLTEEECGELGQCSANCRKCTPEEFGLRICIATEITTENKCSSGTVGYEDYNMEWNMEAEKCFFRSTRSKCQATPFRSRYESCGDLELSQCRKCRRGQNCKVTQEILRCFVNPWASCTESECKAIGSCSDRDISVWNSDENRWTSGACVGPFSYDNGYPECPEGTQHRSIGCQDMETVDSTACTNNFTWYEHGTSRHECHQKKGCREPGLWELTDKDEESCKSCRGKMVNHFRYDSAHWIPGVWQPLHWKPRAYLPLNSWGLAIDSERLDEVIHTALASSFATELKTVFFCKYSSRFRALRAFACACGTGTESETCTSGNLRDQKVPLVEKTCFNGIDDETESRDTLIKCTEDSVPLNKEGSIECNGFDSDDVFATEIEEDESRRRSTRRRSLRSRRDNECGSLEVVRNSNSRIIGSVTGDVQEFTLTNVNSVEVCLKLNSDISVDDSYTVAAVGKVVISDDGSSVVVTVDGTLTVTVDGSYHCVTIAESSTLVPAMVLSNYANATESICTGNDPSCDENQYLDGSLICQSCSACEVDTQYLVSNCSLYDNTVCSNCTITDCASGFYESAACDTDSDRVCSAWKTCTDDEYLSSAGTSTTDAICSPCTSTCAQGSFKTAECSTTMDTKCAVCSTCPGDVETPCSETEDVVCANCKTCTENEWKEAQCTLSADTICNQCSTCTQGVQYQAVDCLSNADRICEDCTVCADDEYETTACSGSTNRVCSKCDTCDDYQEISTACVGSQNTVCADCDDNEYWVPSTENTTASCVSCTTACADGFYKTAECTKDADTVCTPHTTCTLGERYLKVAGTNTSDAVCADCGGNCTNSQYMASACSASANRVCKACSTCLSDQYIASQCSWNSDTVCTTCSSACGNEEYESSPCGEGDQIDRVCSNCTSACMEGTYEAVPCNTATDRKCNNCSTSCPVGTYISSSCTLLKDLTCTKCEECPTGFYSTSVCGGTQKGECTACTVCGDNEYEIQACSGTSNRRCGICDSECDDGFWLSSSCGASSNAVCKQCSTCDDGFFQDNTCTPISDTLCAPCAECSGEVTKACSTKANTVCAGCIVCSGKEYLSEPCNDESPGVCTTCTVRGDDQYLTTACTSAIDAVYTQCTSCGENEYEKWPCTESSNRVCVACSGTCGSGKYLSTACSSKADRVCEAWTVCESDEYEVSSPSPTQNRVCGSCVKCSGDSYLSTACGNGQAGECSDCRQCVEGSQYVGTECSAAKNRACLTCSSCKEGEVQAKACEGSQNRICEDARCIICSKDEYVISSCVIVDDALVTDTQCGKVKCHSNKDCVVGEYCKDNSGSNECVECSACCNDPSTAEDGTCGDCPCDECSINADCDDACGAAIVNGEADEQLKCASCDKCCSFDSFLPIGGECPSKCNCDVAKMDECTLNTDCSDDDFETYCRASENGNTCSSCDECCHIGDSVDPSLCGLCECDRCDSADDCQLNQYCEMVSHGNVCSDCEACCASSGGAIGKCKGCLCHECNTHDECTEEETYCRIFPGAADQPNQCKKCSSCCEDPETRSVDGSCPDNCVCEPTVDSDMDPDVLCIAQGNCCDDTTCAGEDALIEKLCVNEISGPVCKSVISCSGQVSPCADNEDCIDLPEAARDDPSIGFRCALKAITCDDNPCDCDDADDCELSRCEDSFCIGSDCFKCVPFVQCTPVNPCSEDTQECLPHAVDGHFCRDYLNCESNPCPNEESEVCEEGNKSDRECRPKRCSDDPCEENEVCINTDSSYECTAETCAYYTSAFGLNDVCSKTEDNESRRRSNEDAVVLMCYELDNGGLQCTSSLPAAAASNTPDDTIKVTVSGDFDACVADISACTTNVQLNLCNWFNDKLDDDAIANINCPDDIVIASVLRGSIVFNIYASGADKATSNSLTDTLIEKITAENNAVLDVVFGNTVEFKGEEPSPLPVVPFNKPVDVTFTDTHWDEGIVSGRISVTPALDESDITHYVIYWGSSANKKLISTSSISGDLAKGLQIRVTLANFEIASTATHILAFSKNSAGEMTTGVSVPINDLIRVPNNPPSSLTFTDVDSYFGQVGGNVVIGASTDEIDITGYRLYWASDMATKLSAGAAIGAIRSTNDGEDVPVSIPLRTFIPPEATHLLVYSLNANGEHAVPVSLAIVDLAVVPVTPPSGISFIDTDENAGQIAGIVTIAAAATLTDV